MKIRIGYELVYECPRPTPMILMLNVHTSRAADLITPDDLQTEPALTLDRYRDGFENCCTRIVAPAGRTRIFSEGIIRDSGRPEVQAPSEVTPIEALPGETMVFLMGSRYCETDRLSPVAWKLFGKKQSGKGRIQDICDFVHRRIRFDYAKARPTKTAWDVYNEREGVCRDFAHLAIAFCRCMNIPARYCTGYLGDIGVPVDPNPMDFSGWFEAFVDGAWYSFDARHNQPRIGRVVIARGRDATDVALSTAFGPSKLRSFRVITEEIGRAAPQIRREPVPRARSASVG